ncbi:MAG: PQQ-like beta-propeller repeat protein [Planctomycetes bacterium]|nr:PQQ-like beta-propeller repeat protein [Planctomycetota bacterium]
MKKKQRILPIALIAAFSIGWGNGLYAPPSAAQAAEPGNTDLERFLPNNGNSVYPAVGLLRKWPPKGPKELWRTEIGWGKSAVVEANGLAFTATQTDKKQWALALDPSTGAIRWKRELYPKENRHFARGPVTSPVVDGNRVYFVAYATDKDVWDMHCPLVCFNMEGSELWRLNETLWATEASTPLIVGDTLFLGTDNPDRVVAAALDKHTGAIRWTTRSGGDHKKELAAPSSVTYQVVEGIPQIILATYGTREIIGLHADSGTIMWRYAYPAKFSVGLVSSPVAIGSRLFLCAGEGSGKNFSTCLQMRAVDGKLTYEELYFSTELQTNNYNTVAIYQDAVFGFGGLGAAGFLHCTNLSDGRLLWKEETKDWSKDQQLIIADGLLFALTRQEDLVLAIASRDGYQEISRVSLNMELGRPQQPTIANGRLYIRGNREVACFQIVP